MLPLLTSGSIASAASLAAGLLLAPQQVLAREEYYSQLQPCPVSCSKSPDQAQWTLYSSVERLAVCDEPTIFEVSLSTPIKGASTSTRVRACTAGDAENKINSIIEQEPEEEPHEGRIAKRLDLASARPSAVKNASHVELSSWGSRRSGGTSRQSIDLLDKMQQWISDRDDRRPTAIFGHSNGTIAGYFGGARINDKVTATGLFDRLSGDIKKNGIAGRMQLQHCGEHDGRNTTGGVVAGVIVGSDGKFGAVQGAVRSWSKAECPSSGDKTNSWSDFALSYYPVLPPNGTAKASPKDSKSNKRASECTYTRVESGDSCGKLAERCQISPAKFTEINDKDGFCSGLKPGQAVCCSEGDLPDLRPKKNSDGSCHSYAIQSGDTCSGLAATYTLEQEDIMDFNKKTWGWAGCTPLGLGVKICLSEGSPPMPAPVDNAVCGPTKPGSKPPRGDMTLSDLNPCPLRVCCNVWGQCGTTTDFCIEKESETGAPGTSGEHNGCVQNCGMDIVNKGTAPKEFRTLGYFESWNGDRDCLNMDAEQIPDLKRKYTDVHFAFATISSDFDVVIPDNAVEQWKQFRKIDGPRKILAFGGWAFSTESATYQIFRDVVKSANRDAFAKKVVDFAKDNEMDGIDFDWEYPGAPDIPGIPPGDEADGANYLSLLQAVRKILPDGMTLSIAAPASYWYLKGFPINRMEPLLDYIVYMTYDLHGQWDSGNAFSSPGCPAGNCLRSHVNWTETENALSMVTKAGVPTNKLLLGVASYGRAFKMASSGCRGPDCTYLGGKESPAEHGECTDTGGYLANAEIRDIIGGGGNIKTWYDDKTKSNFLVYDGVQWVAWMDDDSRDEREQFAKDDNFGGTIEWAIDLEDFVPAGGTYDPDGDDDTPLGACDAHYDTLDDLAADADNVDWWCGPQYVLEILQRLLEASLKRYQDIIDDGYDGYFDVYAEYIVDTAYKALSSFMFDHGDEYFTCKITEELACCTSCDFEDVSCHHCIKDCNIESAYDDGHEWHNISEPCPPDYSEAGLNNKKYRSIYWTLKEDNEEDFWAELTSAVGAPKDKLPLTKVQQITGWQISTGCAREEAFGDMSQFCYNDGHWFNAPTTRDFEEEDVTNPKDIVSKALDKSKNLIGDLAAVALQVRSGTYDGDGADVVDATAMAVFMIQEGLDYMDEVVDLAKEINEANKKSFIINLLGALLFVIPALGATIGELGLATLGRALVTLGEGGNAALGIYSVVDNPKAAPLAIFGIILGAKGIRDSNAVVKAAKARRTMARQDIMDFSKTVAEKLDKVAKVSAKGKGKQMCHRYA